MLAQGTEPKRFPRNIQYCTRPKGPSFQFFFLHGETVFWEKFFSQGVLPSIFLEFCDKMDVEQSRRVPLFSFFGIVRLSFIKGSPIHQYFDILKSCCYFLALDMAPTRAGHGLFFFNLIQKNLVSLRSMHFFRNKKRRPADARVNCRFCFLNRKK